MAKVSPPPAEAKLVVQRLEKLHSLLKRVAYGRLRYIYDPFTRTYEIVHGQGTTNHGFRLFDGERFLSIAERHIIQGGKLHRVAYSYQLSWPDAGAYQSPNEWIFRFDYDTEGGQRSGFARDPHLNAHHPQPVGPSLMHYPTLGLFPAELFFRVIQTYFPQKRK